MCFNIKYVFRRSKRVLGKDKGGLRKGIMVEVWERMGFLDFKGRKEYF